MIIQRLQTRNFGCLGEREFEFESGLNIIRGPNEAGKSTLQAALLTVLFQKADTTSQSVHRWQSWGAKNLFEITLEFTVAGHRWRLEKNFADKEVCLADLDSGEEWTDHSKVQDEIAQLLGKSVKAVHSYEQGWRSIPPDVERQMLFLLARVFDGNHKRKACGSLGSYS